jgi:hypothetical protein
MDVTPVVNLIGDFGRRSEDCARAGRPGIHHQRNSAADRARHRQSAWSGTGQGRLLGRFDLAVAVFFAPQIMATVHAAFGS